MTNKEKGTEDILEGNGVGGTDESREVEAVAAEQAVEPCETISKECKTYQETEGKHKTYKTWYERAPEDRTSSDEECVSDSL
jgi:hypothetical protein